MATIYLDACAIIEAREKPTPVGSALVDVVLRCSGGEHLVITSELSLLEVLVDPIRGLIDRGIGDEDPRSHEFHDWYRGNLREEGGLIRTLPVDRNVLIQAAIIRARRTTIRTPDAIHVATAKLHGATYLVTNDLRMAKTLDADPAWQAGMHPSFVPMTEDALRSLSASLSA